MKKIICLGFVVIFTITSYITFTYLFNDKGLSLNIKEGISLKIIKLSRPRIKGTVSIEEAINQRCSIRSFKKEDLDLKDLSQLLWAAYGLKNIDGTTSASKTVPSAGALYPMELYLTSSQGVYNYLPDRHELRLIVDKDVRKELADAALSQPYIAHTGINFIITCVYERICKKYGDRGVRYAHIEAGHIAQNIHLQANSLGLSSVPIGAFHDNQVQKVLNIPFDHIPVYIIPVGFTKD